MNNNYQKVDCPSCKHDEKIDDYMSFFHPHLSKGDPKDCKRCNGKGYIIQKASTVKLKCPF